ncbi:MAG TPA: carbohydrate kinase family protein [Blastocatellia bacterium]|jgi:sugar/nucleoside kinase (ribokinase family)
MKPNKQWDVIALGDVFVDLILSGFPAWPKPGEEAFAQWLRREVGGGAAITACGLARLGFRTALLAVVGSEDSRWLIERLTTCGVDARCIQHHAIEPTGLTVSVSTAEDRGFFTYGGANQDIGELLTDKQARDEMMGAGHVHLACAPETDSMAELVRTLHSAGCRVSLDVGWHEAWLSDALGRRALKELDLFLPNEREAQLMTGESEPEAMLRAFARAGLRAVALKLGAEGSALLWEGEIFRSAPYPVQPLDTTGAGDCFDAGFIAAWLRDEVPQVCLETANICGALSTRGLGGLAMFPTQEELATRLIER